MRSNNPRHYLLYINFALFLVLLLEIGFYFFVSPRVTIYQIELESDLPIGDEELRKLLGFERPQGFYNVDPASVERRARSFALIENIQVSKKFPKTLVVRLESRKPVLVLLPNMRLQMRLQTAPAMHASEGENLPEAPRSLAPQSVPILVDEQGVMFQIGLGRYDDVPILSGLGFSQADPLNSLNSRLPQPLHPLVAALGQLKRQRPELYSIISEVRTRLSIAGLETEIYLLGATSYIKTGGKIDAHTIESALIALEVLQRSGEETEYLDMRTTGIVYRPKPGIKSAPKNPELRKGSLTGRERG